MSDRLALAGALEGAGIERAGAERVASVIMDAIRDNVATKPDLQAVEARLDGRIAAVGSRVELVEHRLLTRLGALAVVLSGIIVTVTHYWPPVAHP
jgi:hypothetical protein